MSVPRSGRTLTQEIYEQLRADVLAGRLAPGTRLKFGALQVRYEVSVGVVREALVQLAGRGLVRTEPQVGFMVPELSEPDLIDLTEARLQIECLVFEQALRHGSVEWETAVVAAHHRLSRTPVYEDGASTVVSEDWGAAHARFHLELLAGCPNRRLREVAAVLRDNAELYRFWSQSVSGDGPGRDVAAEHRLLTETVVSRDVAAGVEALRAHIQLTTDILLAHSTTAAPA